MTEAQPLEFSGDESRRPSQRVLDAIAAEEGTSPLSFETPLYEAIDPDALDALVPDEATDATVEFTYRGYRVTVRGTDRIQLTSLDR